MESINGLARLADLLRTKNSIDAEISQIVGRPALIGHVGEYIASVIFNIGLYDSATHKGSDGVFRSGPLIGRSVNIKWYAKHEGLIDLNEAAMPDFYLVLSGPKSSSASSRGGTRPWSIESVFLFESAGLTGMLHRQGTKIGVATSVRAEVWESAQIYPPPRNPMLALTDEQRLRLKLFGITT